MTLFLLFRTIDIRIMYKFWVVNLTWDVGNFRIFFFTKLNEISIKPNERHPSTKHLSPRKVRSRYYIKKKTENEQQIVFNL